LLDPVWLQTLVVPSQQVNKSVVPRPAQKLESTVTVPTGHVVPGVGGSGVGGGEGVGTKQDWTQTGCPVVFVKGLQQMVFVVRSPQAV
jgi:hypothetical protein